LELIVVRAVEVEEVGGVALLAVVLPVEEVELGMPSLEPPFSPECVHAAGVCTSA
jgi:hypothetical protein